jgi:predicted extracellular nuclease
MFKNRLAAVSAAAALAVVAASPASASTVRITEWQYNGSEFIEFTNIDAGAVDFTGWTFGDSGSGATGPGPVSLSAFGVVQAGESVILSEAAAVDFRSLWNLSASVDVIGGNGTNLGRSDAIKLYDSSSVLVDQLVYNDQAAPGLIRTQNISGLPGSAAALGANNQALWIYAVAGDAYGSYTSTTGGFIGNPGSYVAPVPLPAAAWLGVTRRRRGALA